MCTTGANGTGASQKFVQYWRDQSMAEIRPMACGRCLAHIGADVFVEQQTCSKLRPCQQSVRHCVPRQRGGRWASCPDRACRPL